MRKILCLLLLLSAHAFAATSFYVDPLFSGGGRVGSQANPWLSLTDGAPAPWNAINSALASGAVTVFFSQGGTSTAAIDLSSRTDASANILTLNAWSQINSNHTTPSWGSTGITPVPCAVFDVSNANGCVWFSMPKFTITASVPITGPTGSSDFANCKSNFDVEGFLFQSNSGQSANITYLANLTFQYNEVTRVATGSNGPTVYMGPARHGPCHTGATRPSGTDSGPDNVSTLYNYIHGGWGEGIYDGASTDDPFFATPGCTSCQQFEAGASSLNLSCGNGCNSNAVVCTTPGTPATCNTGDSHVIKGNLIESTAAWGGQGDGLDIKDGHTNLTIQNNVLRPSKFPSCAGSCTNLKCWGGTAAGTSCTNNTPCTGGGVCGAGTDGRGMILESGSIVDSNWVEAPGHDAIDLGDSWNNSTGRTDIRVSNNIALNTNSGSGHNQPYELETLNVSGLGKWGNVSFYSNVGFNGGNNSATFSPCISTGAGSATGTVLIKDNIFSTCHSGSSFGIGTGSFNNYFNMTTGSCPGSESNTICTDPKFVSTSVPYLDTNFKLQATSGASAAGTNLSGTFTNDYGGGTRTNPWTIGAWIFATSGPAVSLAPTTLPFGNVTVGVSSSPQSTTLTNTGGSILNISAIALGGANPTAYAIDSNGCGSTLAASANCIIQLHCHPLGAGALPATLDITSDASTSVDHVTLTCTGVATAPAVSLSPTSLSFGNQVVNTTSAPQTILMTNTGTATLTITSISGGGANPTQYHESDNCGATLAPGDFCTISITFNPTTAGSKPATVAVVSSAASSPDSATLSGTGTTPAAVGVCPGCLARNVVYLNGRGLRRHQ